MKTHQKKDEKRHGHAQSDRQMRDVMTTGISPNNYPTRAMRKSIEALEQNGFTLRCIEQQEVGIATTPLVVRANFVRTTLDGLLTFSVRIDTDGNVTNIIPQSTRTQR